MKKTIILLLVLSLIIPSLYAQKKKQQDLFLSAVNEKDPQTKLQKLEEYYDIYGQKEDRMSKFLHLNLCLTAYQLKQYDKSILYGEKTLSYEDLAVDNKLRVYLCLSDSFFQNKKDLDKSYDYADLMLKMGDSLKNEDVEKPASMASMDIDKVFIYPALFSQLKIQFEKGKTDPSALEGALTKAVECYKINETKAMANNIYKIANSIYSNGKIDEAIAALTFLGEQSPEQRIFAKLGLWYNKKGDKATAAQFFEESYKIKPNAKLAYNIALLVRETDLDKAIEYLAESHQLNAGADSEKSFKLLEHLYFNIKAKDLPEEEKEAGFKDVLAKAKERIKLLSEIEG